MTAATSEKGPITQNHKDLSLFGESLPRLFGWIAAYTILALLTRAYFMADTVDYVSAVYLHDRGVNYLFWDFRHLFWRPLGWILLHLFGSWTSSFTGNEPRIAVLYIFMALDWLSGIISLFSLRFMLRRFQLPQWSIEISSLGFVVSFAFLNFIHAGTSYVPGLMFLLLGMCLIVRATEPGVPRYLHAAAALSLALSVCMWFPYAFAVPGALALPLFYRNPSPRPWSTVLRSTVLCLVFGVVAYGSVLADLHIYSLAGARGWISQGASSVAGVHGVSRVIFGFAHSFIDLGNDGVLVKRYMLHDPYNPVTLRDLARLSLGKLAFFYLVLFVIILQFARSGAGRNILAIFAVSAGPVLIFAVFWFGGDIERYLPLYPVVFLVVAFALANDRKGLVRIPFVAFLALAVGSNIFALSRQKLDHEQQMVVDRIQPLIPLLKPSSRVVEVDIHDGLVNFSRSFPLDPINRNAELSNYPLLNPGTPQTKHWRSDFAVRVRRTWNTGGDIWLSRRLLAYTPRADWDWIENSDPNLHWKDLPTFFSQFDVGPAVGGEDGFSLLLPTLKNQALVAPLLPAPQFD
jgi:hypothetical protein